MKVARGWGEKAEEAFALSLEGWVHFYKRRGKNGPLRK